MILIATEDFSVEIDGYECFCKRGITVTADHPLALAAPERFEPFEGTLHWQPLGAKA